MLEVLGNTLTPFLWGGALALVLNIPLKRLERCLHGLHPRLRRLTALTLVMLGLAAAILLGLWLLVPQLLAAIADLAKALPQIPAQLAEMVGQSGAESAEMAENLKALSGAGAGGLEQLWQAGLATLKAAAGTLGELFLALILAVYLLGGKENLAHKAKMVCRALLGEEKTKRILALAGQAGAVFSGFIAGQCIEACILAGLFVLTLLLFRMPYVLPISAVIGVTALIPVFGAWAGCAIGALLILPISLQKAGIFLILFFAVQQFENNVIYPRVVGSRIGLPPLWVLAAVLLGGGLFGAAGLILGIPAMSVLYHVGGEWVRMRLGQEPK
ncbi:MAG: AI-2E family transporter [Faecalibacterium sp.]|jgi:predicted PurR-regulated permease PerM|nr:AI-2E family transporter [Faecalibacterium sp.]